MWWPREIWGQYAERLSDFLKPGHAHAAVQCLDHMVRRTSSWGEACLLFPQVCHAMLQVLDALGHATNCLNYLRCLKHPAIFRFCALPQVQGRGAFA